MGEALEARVLGDADYPRWRAFVAASPTGSAYSLAEYLDVLCGATGGRFRIVAVEKGGEIAGGVALYEQPSRFGRFVSDRKLLYYNGLVLRDFDTKYPSQRTSKQIEVLDAIERGVTALGIASVRLKSRSPFTDARLFMDRGWTATPSYSYVVTLDDLKGAWERVEQNLRRLVDRCTKQDVVLSTDDDFESFWRLHAAVAERKGAPLYLPRAAFARWFERLRAQGLCQLFHARMPDGRVAASQLVLLGHPVTHTVSAAADAELQNLGVNPFLRWRAFEALAAAGHRANDLTDATLNPVTHFKSQLGGALEVGWVLASRETRKFRWGRSAMESLARMRKK